MNEKYIPLYRKYRPQRLEEIVGQEHIKKALSNAISSDKISHAYLFTGPRGTGKTSTARIFAKSLNCVNGPTVSPCGECENCKNIANSVPIDVIEIDAASNRSVNDADEIIQKVALAPVSSRYKIYIIDEVHMLTPQAFNALLKTLEEPPKNVIFILATTEVHSVLDTIKSRCQRFDFKRITTDDIAKHLRSISDKEGINITDDALSYIAKSSAGGMRDSIALLDQLSILNSETPISVDDINNLLGRISFDVLREMSDSVINSDPKSALSVLERVYNSGNEPIQIFTSLLEYFKNMLVVKNCEKDVASDLTQLNISQIEDIQRQIAKIETHQIVALIEKISDYILEIKKSNNPRLWLEVGIIDVANLTANTTLKDLQDRLTALEGGMSVSVSSHNYSTAPSPVPSINKIKEMIGQKSLQAEKSDINSSPSTATVSEKEKETLVNNSSKSEVDSPKAVAVEEAFSPMPKSKPISSDDIGVLWGQLISGISSVPCATLLKQWGNPVKISPEETIISIKTDIFLKKFESGSRRDAVIESVDKMFSQSNSKVIIRLPLPEDVPVKPVPASKPQPRPISQPKTENIDEEEINEVVNDMADQKNNEQTPQIKSKTSVIGHSDQVNMAVDLFDGKIIE